MAPYVADADIIFLTCGFFCLLFSSPNLSRRKLDVCRACTHGVALVRLYDAGLKLAARGSLEIQDAKTTQKSPSRHHCTTLSGYIFARRHVSTTGKKNLLSINISSRCLHNIANFGPLAAEIGWQVWGTPANFNGVRVLASLLRRRRSPDANQTLHDLWSSPGLVHYVYIFGGSCPLTEFCAVQN